MQRKKGKLVHILFIFLALTIILDFLFPGTTYTNKVVDVEKKLEQYYNVAGNYHYSYQILTNNH